MVENCMSGYNSCMFAYGQVGPSMAPFSISRMVCSSSIMTVKCFLQTGSGKTYTMMGDFHEMDNMLSEDCGMTPRIFEYLFMRIKQVGSIDDATPET